MNRRIRAGSLSAAVIAVVLALLVAANVLASKSAQNLQPFDFRQF